MADATEYNVRWPLYDPPSFSSPSLSVATAAKSVLLRPRPRVRRGRRGDAAEAAIRHAPGRWSVTSAASIVRGVEGESLGRQTEEDINVEGKMWSHFSARRQLSGTFMHAKADKG